MAIRFKKKFNEEVYDVIPEEIPKAITEKIKYQRHLNERTNGYNESRSMRHIASVDYGLMYNYAMFKGIPPKQHNEFYTKDNCKNLIALINEFPDATKVVDKPI